MGGGGGSREQPRKVLNSPPPMDTASLQVHKEQFPIKKKKAKGQGEGLQVSVKWNKFGGKDRGQEVVVRGVIWI